MNYFFELLDSYHKRGCCVTRINEQEVSLAQDPRLAQLQTLIKNPPEGTKVTASKKYPGAFSVNDPRVQRIFTIDAQGMFVGGTDAFNRGVLTKLFGPLEGEQPQEDAEQSSQNQQQQIQQPPMMDPQQMREEAAKQTDYTNINSDILDILQQMASDGEAVCRSKIRFDLLTNDLRPEKGEFKTTLKTLRTATGNDTLSQSLAKDLTQAFKDFYTNKSSACEFIDKISNLSSDPKIIDSIAARYLNGSLDQARINILGHSQNSIANSIEFAYDPNIAQTFKKLLDGSCQAGEPCTFEENLDDTDKEALRDSMAVVLDLAKKDKLTSDEKLLLTSLLRLTDDRRIALAGVTPMDSVIIPDRGRAFLDLLRFIERKHGIEFDVIPVLGKIETEGSENQAIGTLFEHWKKIVGLSLAIGKAESPEEKAALEKVMSEYMTKIREACKTMQAIDRRIRATGKDVRSIPIQAHEELQEVKHDSLTCSELSDINKLLTSRVLSQFSKIGLPDAVVQTGAVVGKGSRSDTMLSYDDPAAARNAAIASGLRPKAVKKMKMGKLLDMNPEFRESLREAGLLTPGSTYDPDKVVYVVPEGLKTSSAKGSTGVNTGSASLASIGEDLSLAAKGGKSDWVRNVADHLGITNSAAAAKKVSSLFEKDFKAIDTSVDKALPKVNIDGTLENTARLSATEIMRSIRKSSTAGENTKKDEAFAVASKFADEANKANPDPKKLEKLKTRLKEVLHRRALESKLSSLLDSNDIRDREAGALLLGLVGGVNSDQSLHYVDLMSEKQFTGDHNTLAVGPLKALIEGTEGYSYGITRAGESFALGITTPGGSSYSIRFTGTKGGSTTATCSVSKSLFKELGFINLNEGKTLTADKKILSEVVKLLKGQLIHLHRIFG